MTNLLPRHAEPIVAIATAPGRGALGILRASGRDLSALIAGVCARPLTPRRATYTAFVDAAGEAIDRGIAVHYAGPHSSTGEDVLELHAHGGPVVLRLLLQRCLEAQPGLRLARPGEFTERAFLNDRMDLAQAEAVGDLIDARTEAAARAATRSLDGAFSQAVEAIAVRVLALRTLVEATLDFPEEDIEFIRQADGLGRLRQLLADVDAVSAGARRGALLRDGLRVVLAGQPNVGKSSLLNALAGADIAIVTAQPGTTRDRLRETVSLDGVPVEFIDTAGLRDVPEGGDDVERIGIERSWQSIGEADVVVFLRDLSRWGEAAYAAGDAEITARLAAAPAARHGVLEVHNKSDAMTSDVPAVGAAAMRVSARTGAGLDALRSALIERVGGLQQRDGGEGVHLARARHLEALDETRSHLRTAHARLDAPDPALDLLAEDLRLAHGALGRIVGLTSTEDLLGEIFGRFCIGK